MLPITHDSRPVFDPFPHPLTSPFFHDRASLVFGHATLTSLILRPPKIASYPISLSRGGRQGSGGHGKEGG